MIKQNQTQIYILMILAMGYCFRLATAIWPQGFWSDELNTLFYAQISIQEGIHRDNSPPGFVLLLRFWMQLFPHTEQALRLLPCALSIITLSYIYFRWKNVLVTLFFAINPASISFAGDLKYSSLLELFCVLWVGEFMYLWDTPITRNRILKLTALTLGIGLSNYIGLLLVLSGLLFLLVQNETTAKSKKIISTLIVLFSICLIMIYFRFVKYFGIEWMKNTHQNIFDIFWILGSYSRAWASCIFMIAGWFLFRYRSKLAIWFFILSAIYLIIDWLPFFSLTGGRYIIPLQIVSTLMLASAFSDSFKLKYKYIATFIFVIGIGIQLKKISEDVTEIKSAWQEASQVLGNIDAYVFGHPSIRYYFPEKKIVDHWPQELTEKKSVWIVSSYLVSFMKEKFKQEKSNLKYTKLNEVGLSARERIYLYKVEQE